ncbi:MAG: type II secretion system F family protein [bacterium]|nr:type II secretion system F family protein [bacterium]
MKITYKAVGKDGKVLHGTIEAKDVSEAVSYLHSKQLTPIDVTPQKNNLELAKLLPFVKKTHSSDLVFFTRQLSSMITSGLTLMQALNILRQQTKNEAMAKIIEQIVTEIEDGNSFSSALSKHPDVFSSIYVSLIKAAETSGVLDKVLLRLAETLEKQEKLKSTIKGALMYPIIVILGMVAVMTLMMIVVIPQLSVLFESLNVELPLTTQIVIGMSKFMISFWPVIIVFVILSMFVFRQLRKTESGKLILDQLVLKLPIFGNLISQTILAQFTRTLALLIGTGNLVVDSLNQSANVAGNVIYRDAIINVAKRVEKGISIGDSMSAYPLFPPLLVQLVKIGEQTGKLDDSFLRSSEYFEGEVDQMVKTLTTAMEPLIMVFLGLGVGFLIMSIIMPIYSITSAIQ